VAAEIRSLADAPSLPEAGDLEALIPPSLPAHTRRVEGTDLWIWYTSTADVLTLRALTTGPP
jgi:hypothetical protein